MQAQVVEPCRQKTRTTSVARRERIQVQHGPKEAPYRKSSHKDFLWRAGMLVWAVQQLGESRALLKERQNEIWVSLSGHSKRAIRFFDVAAMRFVRGRA